jgi:zinc transport system substrate-binding protein
MFSRLIKFFSFLLAGVILLGGCGQSRSMDGKAGPNGDGGGFTIVTSFYPMYISAINVAKDIPGVEVVNMTKPQTGCLHDYQLSPEDLRTLERADAFVINGAGMEAFMDKVLSQQKDLRIVEASKGIELLKDEDGEENPHVWVSISDAIIQVRNISGQLASIDTANALKYRSNADAYIERLEALKEKMHRSLDGIKNKDIITFHEAFPYFAKEFGLNIAAVIEREPGTSPSPKELEDTIRIIRDSGIRALFAEPQYPAKAADMIAAETGAKVYDLDPAVTGEARPGAYDEYLNVMERNLKTLEEALK